MSYSLDLYDLVETYADPMDHITDELVRLDYIIECEIRRMNDSAQEADVGAQSFRGMFLSAEEALQLLDEDEGFLKLGGEQDLILQQVDSQIAIRAAKTAEQGVVLPIFRLQERFSLSDQDLRMLIVCLAPHIQRKYLKLYGYLHDDLTRQYVSLDLLLRLCTRGEEDRRQAMERLLNPKGSMAPFFARPANPDAAQEDSVLMRPMRLVPRIIHFLLGLEYRYSGTLASMALHTAEDNRALPPLKFNRQLHEAMTRHTREADSGLLIWSLWGPQGSGKTFHARKIAGELNRPLLEWDISRTPPEAPEFQETIEKLFLEAKLENALLAFDKLHLLDGGREDRRLEWLMERLEEWEGVVFLFSEQEIKLTALPDHARWIPVELTVPDLEDSRELWREFAEGKLSLADREADMLAAKFRFTPGQMADAVQTAAARKSWTSPDGSEELRGPSDGRLLHQAAYQLIHHRLKDKAVKLQSKVTWEDLVLPEQTVQLLKQACLRLIHRHTVMHKFGFARKLPYGRGISMLFTGPPGTGKTMSASVIANELDAELYRVDLSRVVSKYIGETEKNLSEIFDQARLSGAILFFDEADALFGKRSEVKDAHDKYANMETAYLLQKMEEYDGITILATNFAQNLDEAFTRRIQFIVKFPFPDAAQREQLWRASIPPQMPAGEIDFAYLAQTFELTGGPIKNIVLTAAYLAAHEGVPVSMKQIMEGAAQEYKKIGKLFPKERLGKYAEFWKG